MKNDEILKALAHPVRLQIVHWLKNPEHYFSSQEHSLDLGVCASQFSRCGLSQSAVSAHLAVLQRAELVTIRRVGQWVYYKRNEDTIASFLRDMTGII
ncbi:metalloregulator ArsR/SmtB family transcription factor [Phyllobacterium sp. P30BS-XVII]|uniref:ArsR/SmtB family transcription factor n=1 Tax=Phyllobacterium sp. P30BS-XVII TaxID=2587046 RepID=UPI0015FA8C7B|nr:metalloregulator ArsR/SmtB family transcription factor [Phyllobacterium sp. P30BS-XVII]MBA8902987.1 ArsR family transcriptional regulator [Phyllobacterium sp. P30BS-XVII]